MLFVESSAKSGLNVEQAFVDASACDILAKIRQGVFDDDRVRLLFSLFPFPLKNIRLLEFNRVIFFLLVSWRQAFKTKHQPYMGWNIQTDDAVLRSLLSPHSTPNNHSHLHRSTYELYSYPCSAIFFFKYTQTISLTLLLCKICAIWLGFCC